MAGWMVDDDVLSGCNGILCPNLRRLETVGPTIWEAACLESESECRENELMVTWLRMVDNVKLHLKKWMKVNLWSPPFPDRGWWWLMRCLQAAWSPSVHPLCPVQNWSLQRATSCYSRMSDMNVSTCAMHLITSTPEPSFRVDMSVIWKLGHNWLWQNDE